MRKLRTELIKLIAIFEYLIYIENFGAYKSILKSFNTTLINIDGRQNYELLVKDFEPLINTYRIFSEATPSDNILAKYIYKKMQEFYELQEATFNKIQ